MDSNCCLNNFVLIIIILYMSTINISIRRTAIISGVASIVMFFAAIIAEFYARQGIIIQDNATATAQNLLNNPFAFRVGMLGFLVILICDVLVSWALCIFLSPVHRYIALLAAVFRLIYTGIFASALTNLMMGFRLITNTQYTGITDKNGLYHYALLQFNAFDDGWAIGLVFFGVHLLLLAYLIIMSGFIPKIIGVLLFFASIAYMIDNIAKLIVSDYQHYKNIFTMAVAIPSIIGELGFALWLLIRGSRLRTK